MVMSMPVVTSIACRHGDPQTRGAVPRITSRGTRLRALRQQHRTPLAGTRTAGHASTTPMTMLDSKQQAAHSDDQLAGVAREKRLMQRRGGLDHPAMRIVTVVGQRTQHVAGAVDANDARVACGVPHVEIVPAGFAASGVHLVDLCPDGPSSIDAMRAPSASTSNG